MNRFCKLIVGVFAVLYIAALALLAIGTFGLFGNEPDPLSGIFLLPLGLPWTFVIDGAPEPLLPWLAIAAPAVNLVLLYGLCRLLSGRRRDRGLGGKLR